MIANILDNQCFRIADIVDAHMGAENSIVLVRSDGSSIQIVQSERSGSVTGQMEGYGTLIKWPDIMRLPALHLCYIETYKGEEEPPAKDK